MGAPCGSRSAALRGCPPTCASPSVGGMDRAIRRLAIAVFLLLPVAAAHAQTFTAIYPNGVVRFAYPSEQGGNLYVVHTDGRTSNIYPLPGDAFSTGRSLPDPLP